VELVELVELVVPDLDGAILATTGNTSAIRRPVQCVYLILVAWEGVHSLFQAGGVLCVPKLESGIFGARHEKR